eukprot:10822401-Ditylum_brightwellii.AAC.1
MLEQEVLESTVKENILMSPFIADIHEATFRTIEKTVEDLDKVLADVETLLEVLPDVFVVEYFNKFEAFPALWVIPTYGTTYKYTEQITSNVSTVINEKRKTSLLHQSQWLDRSEESRQPNIKGKYCSNNQKSRKQCNY